MFLLSRLAIMGRAFYVSIYKTFLSLPLPANIKGCQMDDKKALCEVLESYIEFIDIMEKTLERANLPAKYGAFAMLLIKQRRDIWEPVWKKLKDYIDGRVQM